MSENDVLIEDSEGIEPGESDLETLSAEIIGDMCILGIGIMSQGDSDVEIQDKMHDLMSGEKGFPAAKFLLQLAIKYQIPIPESIDPNASYTTASECYRALSDEDVLFLFKINKELVKRAPISVKEQLNKERGFWY